MISADPVFLTAEIRDIEQQSARLPKPPRLMEKAGLAAAQVIRDQLLKGPGHQILVLAGPGNNGGDAFVVARYLQEWGNAVTVVFGGDGNRVPPDAKQALHAWFDIGGDIYDEIPDCDRNWDIVVDGLFGIGLDQSQHRPIEGKYRDWIETVNPMAVPIVALDIPSGLGSDDGCIYGIAIRATLTITFIGLKPGLYTHSGPECCGTIVLRDLDIQLPAPPEPRTWLLNQKLAQSLLPPARRANSHKGTFGNVAILGGSAGMTGAALLAGRAALHLGAGRVYLGLLADNAPPVDFSQPELMLRAPSGLFTLAPLNCLIVGPGLGQSAEALPWLEKALTSDCTLIIDADALNLIAQHSPLAKTLGQRHAATILTPHPAEAARLLNTGTAAVQQNRMNAALQIGQQFNCHVVLKGAGSICCFPDGTRYLNTSGNPALSTAGTGDVLAGMMGALIAQGLNPGHALLLAVYLHGAAADRWVQQHHGMVGMVASEVIAEARLLLNEWVYR
ncbi:NAD(P)H-hydrate dehydratase [Nitrosomonas oligotropha]|uniref:NAD(P)H-hydrate dehydratase n=1 Tax=Nitrosomonas oligotropha TaxID=42354 RepID=UPI00136C4523|nr:NAD(P)H-hydrate dehydratase [Nitrosomonas oligotropha]MXS83304.1 NAD(P)H-hydrate dehydratase [Nitrosomonas oligotropha]